MDSARHDMRPRRDRGRVAGAIVKFALASVAVLGIGAAVTTAAWTDDVTFGATSSAPAFQMQYSFTNAAGSWQPFPESGTVTLSNWPAWVTPATPTATHSVFVRNIGQSATTVRVEPVKQGLFTDPGLVTVSAGLNSGAMATVTGPSADVAITGTQVARIDLKITPSVLQQHSETRQGSLAVTVSGTVGATS